MLGLWRPIWVPEWDEALLNERKQVMRMGAEVVIVGNLRAEKLGSQEVAVKKGRSGGWREGEG